VSQKVVVQGEVTEPGVYEIKGHATLLEVISMAKGETKVAATRQVAVFRNISGQRTGALFDVAAIRRGEAADPELLGSDVVIVGLSNAKSTWRDILATAPMLAVFRPLGM
jgi:polysaccharide export outer membrane protein